MSLFFNILTLIIAVLVGYLYWLGLEGHLFWVYWWYDIPMHMLAGLVVGLWGSALASRRDVKPYQALIFVLLTAFAIGVMWEIFEVSVGITRGEPGYWADTIKDLVDDCLGAAAAVLLYWNLYRKNINNG